MGRVKPVMTVDRQELRKQNTMKIVRSPPSNRVICTSSTDSRMNLEESRTISRRTPEGISFERPSSASSTPSATLTVLAPDCFKTFRATAGTPFTIASDLGSSIPSRTCPTPSTEWTAVPPCDHHIRVCCDLLWFARHPDGCFIPFTVETSQRSIDIFLVQSCNDFIYSQSQSLQSNGIQPDIDLSFRISDQIYPANPGTFSMRLLILFSARVVSSLAPRVSERTAREITGAAEKSSF